jgi:AcrR family transcriptional regulator
MRALASTALDDLTARARIRDAALHHFATHGHAGATLRGIAADAGVSLGLVQHHFGSKDGLRAACDAYVMDRIRAYKVEMVEEGKGADPAFLDAAFSSAPLLSAYLIRGLLENTPAGAALFDELVAMTEAYFVELGIGGDVRAYAAVLTAMKLGIHAFQSHLLRALDGRELPRGAYPRVARAALDLIAPRFVDSELAAQARRGLDGLLESGRGQS